MKEDGTLHGDRYLKPGTRVRLNSLADGERGTTECGVIVHCWRDQDVGAFDCYIAFFGDDFPTGDPVETPYILRYFSSTLATEEDVG